jgi:hypothetical protein
MEIMQKATSVTMLVFVMSSSEGGLLLVAAIWREINSAEAQPQAAFLEALSRLVGRWLMVRSDAPGMDVVTVLCKARGYIARQEELEWTS